MPNQKAVKKPTATKHAAQKPAVQKHAAKKPAAGRKLRPSGLLRLILAGSVAVLLLAVLILSLLPLKTVTYEGLSFYTQSEMEEYILGSGRHRAAAAHLKELFGKHVKIPFIEKYSVSFDGFRNMRVTVYERSVSGYIDFHGFYLYFDWDGNLVESSDRKPEDIYAVTGLPISHAVVGEKLPVEDPTTFHTVLTVSQFLSSQKTQWRGENVLLGTLANEIHFGSAGVSVIYPDITVLLGSAEYLEEKLALMADMLPELDGRSGTLYLNSYKPDAVHPSYIFK